MALPSKTELRDELTAARRARRSDQLGQARAAICNEILRYCDRELPRCVAAYVPLRTEPGSVELLAELAARAIRVLVPVLLIDNDLDWRVWTGSSTDDAGSVPLGVDAIGAAELVLVPALAVAADGTRLGRGGGSYDRALPRVRGDAKVAALLFDGELLPALPRDPWDRPVDAVVVPSGWREVDDR